MKQINKNLNKIFSNPGSRLRKEYIRLNDDNGFPIMKVNNTVNQYAEIQSYKDDNTIERIMERLGGDISKLDLNKGVYIDVSKIPNNYNDLMNTINVIADDYSKLPVKYKQALKNNYNLYYGLAMTGKIKDFISDFDNVEKTRKLVNNVNFDFGSKQEVKQDVKQEVNQNLNNKKE